MTQNFDVVYENITTNIENLVNIDIQNEEQLYNHLFDIVKNAIIRFSYGSYKSEHIGEYEQIVKSITSKIDLSKLIESKNKYDHSYKKQKGYNFKRGNNYFNNPHKRRKGNRYDSSYEQSTYHSHHTLGSEFAPNYQPYVPQFGGHRESFPMYSYNNAELQNNFIPSILTKQHMPSYHGKEDNDSFIINVSSIPENLNSIEKINEHFQKFGKIVNIEILLNEKIANIKFSDRMSATNAINSPDPVFGNRFIEINWFKKDSTNPKPMAKKKYNETKPHINKRSSRDKSTYISDEYKKIITEKRENIIQSKDSLKLKLKVYDGLIRKIDDELSKGDIIESRRATLSNQKLELEQKKKDIQSNMKNIDFNSLVSKDVLLKRYEDLKQRLKISQDKDHELNINKNINKKVNFSTPTQLSIDLRPRTIRIKNNLDMEEKDVSNHFEKFGSILNISNEDGYYFVQMATRKDAEAAIHKGQSFHGHSLDMEWVENKPTNHEIQKNEKTNYVGVGVHNKKKDFNM